jgi:hemerythrin-like domain-containing protein
MQRHPSLIPLSHDHHHALVLSRRVQQELEKDRVEAMVDYVCQFRTDELERHFEEEEVHVFPLIPDTDERVLRAMLEHRQLRNYVTCAEHSTDRDEQSRSLLAFAKLLHDHVRFEERELFPYIELKALLAD